MIDEVVERMLKGAGQQLPFQVHSKKPRAGAPKGTSCGASMCLYAPFLLPFEYPFLRLLSFILVHGTMRV